MERGTRPLTVPPVEREPVDHRRHQLPTAWHELGDLPLLPGMRSTKLPVHALRASQKRFRLALLIVLDIALIVFGFILAYYLRYEYEFWSEVTFVEPLRSFAPTIALLVPFTIGLLSFKGFYRQPRNAGSLTQLGTILSSVTTAVTITIVITFLYKPWYYSRLIFALAWAMIVLSLAVSRVVLNRWRHWRWNQGQDLERVLVVGGSGLGRQIMRNLQTSPSLGYRLVGYLHEQNPSVTRADNGGEAPEGAQLLGTLTQLPAIVDQHKVDHVIIALPSWHNRHLPDVVDMCHNLGVPFQVAPDFYELSFDRVTIQELRGVPLLGLRENVIRGWNYALKRALDVGLVVLTSPVWLVLSLLIMVLIRLDSPGPVIFRQTRWGRNGRPFVFLKFRTMVTNAEQLKEELLAYNERAGPAFKMKNDPRVTRVGRWLRRTSLDELPQLWNVLRGEMSLVGPRPAVPEEIAKYEPWQRRRLEVMPGLTGLWVVTGRANMSFEEQVRLDIYYAEHWSVAMDLRILLLSVPAVLSGRGAY